MVTKMRTFVPSQSGKREYNHLSSKRNLYTYLMCTCHFGYSDHDVEESLRILSISFGPMSFSEKPDCNCFVVSGHRKTGGGIRE